MRDWLKASWILGLLILVLNGISPQEPLLGDLLNQGWQAELRNEISKASSAYARAVALRPEDPLLRLKYAEMLILLDRPDEVARQLVQALELLSKDPKAPVDLKRFICDLLMGRLPTELRQRRMQLGYDYEGWLFPSPFATLPVETQKQVLKLVPKDWLFPTKASEAWFLLSIGEKEQGLKLLQEAAAEGDFKAPVYTLMSPFVRKEQRIQIAQNWLRDAERKQNPFLWLATLHLLWRTGQIDAFRSGFPKAIAAMRDQPALLVELAELCRQMRWDAGRKQVIDLLPPSLKPAPEIADLLKEFQKALDEGDLAKVKVLIRILVDFPDLFRSTVLGSSSIRKMLGHRWHDFVVELIQLDLVPELPYETRQVLLRDAAFNPSLFSHWMRLFMSNSSRSLQETVVNLLEATAGDINEPEPEKAIWLLEQGLLICPDEPRLLKLLALAYNRAGYPNRAIEILKGVVLRSAKEGFLDSYALGRLWDIAYWHQQLPELIDWLRAHREQLPLSYFVETARLCLQKNKVQEALQWLDEALTIAKERGWLGDAEIHAQAYYLVKSPDPAVAEEGQKLRAKVMRTHMLFYPSTYELRLTCLLRLGRKEEAEQVLDEAKRLYPDYPFTRHVQGLAQIAVTDWNEALQREIERWQNLGAPNYAALIHLAYATYRAGKASEAKQIADKLMAGNPHWRDGYLLAVEMFSQGVDKLVPFVRWVHRMAVSERRFASWHRAVESTEAAIRTVGEHSLASAFMLASVLLFPEVEGTDLHEMMQMVEFGAHQWWASLKGEDRERLKAVLQKERINMYALNLMTTLSYRRDLMSIAEGEALRKWIESLKGSQTQSAKSLICQIRRNLPQIDKDRLGQLLAALERANWSDANWCPLIFGLPMPLAKELAQRGFREEAIKLLQIAIKHVPEEHKANLMAQLTELTGKLPERPKGEEAKDGKAWLLQAQIAWRTQRHEEAKQAALKALELGLPLEDQAEALKVLAEVAPEDALKQIQQRLPNFLVTQPNTDPPNHLLKLANTIYRIAETRKDLAADAAPLLERACNFSEWMMVNTFSELALVHLWAGNKLRGITVLFEQLGKGKPQWNLRKVIGAMVRSDVPPEARRQISEHLRSYLLSRKVSLSTIADEIGSVEELNLLGSFNPQTRRSLVEVAPESLMTLAKLLMEHLREFEGIVPREFLEKVLHLVKGFAVVKKPFSQERLLPDEVVDAWWELFEAAFKKAARTQSDAQSLKQWLRKFYVERPDTYFSQTVWFERLRKLAE